MTPTEAIRKSIFFVSLTANSHFIATTGVWNVALPMRTAGGTSRPTITRFTSLNITANQTFADKCQLWHCFLGSVHDVICVPYFCCRFTFGSVLQSSTYGLWVCSLHFIDNLLYRLGMVYHSIKFVPNTAGFLVFSGLSVKEVRAVHTCT